MMKWVFLLTLLIVGGMGAVLGGAVVYHWTHNMFYTQRVMPGEISFSMPTGSLPRHGGQLYYSPADRDAAAARRNPVAATPESVKRGEALFTIYCTPCHGTSGRGDGPVSTRFVPPADLTNPDLQKVRTDGYWQSYLSVGGAVMPSYGEALSPEERWDVVNYVRTLAKK
jgi:mono/diheme cytochrome c family protein